MIIVTEQTGSKDIICNMSYFQGYFQYNDEATQRVADAKVTKRVTFANQLVSAAAPPVSEEHIQPLKCNWYSNQEYVQSEKAASAEASTS